VLSTFIIIIIIIIIIILVVPFMRGFYNFMLEVNNVSMVYWVYIVNYMLETNNVSRVYRVYIVVASL